MHSKDLVWGEGTHCSEKGVSLTPVHYPRRSRDLSLQSLLLSLPHVIKAHSGDRL